MEEELQQWLLISLLNTRVSIAVCVSASTHARHSSQMDPGFSFHFVETTVTT